MLPRCDTQSRADTQPCRHFTWDRIAHRFATTGTESADESASHAPNRPANRSDGNWERGGVRCAGAPGVGQAAAASGSVAVAESPPGGTVGGGSGS